MQPATGRVAIPYFNPSPEPILHSDPVSRFDPILHPDPVLPFDPIPHFDRSPRFDPILFRLDAASGPDCGFSSGPGSGLDPDADPDPAPHHDPAGCRPDHLFRNSSPTVSVPVYLSAL
jgi:hypothetical protein